MSPSTDDPRPHRRSVGLWVTAASAIFLYLLIFRAGTVIFLFSVAEGGVWIDEAQRVVAGEVMYRDFFEFVPPGIVYLNAALILLFGPWITVFGYAAVALGALLTYLIYVLSAVFVGPRWRLLPPAAFAVVVYAPYSLWNHKWPMTLCGLLGLLGLARGAATPRASALAGALMGISTLFTADFGVGLAAGTFVYLLTEASGMRRRKCFAYGLGYLATSVPPMLYFVAKAGFDVVFYDCVVFPFTHYRESNAFHVLLTHHWGPRTQAQLALSFAGIVGALLLLPRKAGEDPARLVSFAGLGLLLATAHRPITPLDLSVRCALLLPVAVRGLELLRGRPERRLRWAGRAVLLVILAGVLWGSLPMIARRQWLDPLTRESHRAGEIWARFPMPELAWVERETREWEPVFLLPHKGGLHFLSHTASTTSFPYVVSGQNPDEHLQELLGEIERSRPAVGVWGSVTDLPRVYQALTRTYRVERILPNGNVLLRRGSTQE